jgi:hypothetical protein
MMFAKTYRYRIREADFRRWLEICQLMKELYSFHGLPRIERMARQAEPGIFSIQECVYAHTSDAFLRATAKIDDDPRIHSLFQSFLALVIDGEIVQEEWDVY